MDTEDEACRAWCRPSRGEYRLEVEICGPRVWVKCKGDVMRIVIQRVEGGSQVETDLVGTVEVHSWATGKILKDFPPDDGQAISSVIP